MTTEQAHSILDSYKWTFAKTMPKNPHWYIKRFDFQEQKDFEDLVQYIRDNGKERRWFKKVFVYYAYNDYEYWTMGNSLEVTKIINKAKIKVSQPTKRVNNKINIPHKQLITDFFANQKKS